MKTTKSYCMEDVEDFYDNVAETYYKDHMHRFVDEVFEHLLLQYLPKSPRNILDAGGGIGRFSFPLTKRGYTLVLTDISQKMIDRAKELASSENIKNISFFKESVTNMINQKNNFFDVVLLLNGVLDYCSSAKDALQEVHRVLKKHGLVIGTINNRFIYSTTNILLEKKDTNAFLKTFMTGNYAKNFPIHDFTHDEIMALLKDSDFEVIDILGPTNLLRKWEYETIVTEENRSALLALQLSFAKKKEYLNNSTDFFIIAKKI